MVFEHLWPGVSRVHILCGRRPPEFFVTSGYKILWVPGGPYSRPMATEVSWKDGHSKDKCHMTGQSKCCANDYRGAARRGAVNVGFKAGLLNDPLHLWGSVGQADITSVSLFTPNTLMSRSNYTALIGSFLNITFTEMSKLWQWINLTFWGKLSRFFSHNTSKWHSLSCGNLSHYNYVILATMQMTVVIICQLPRRRRGTGKSKLTIVIH